MVEAHGPLAPNGDEVVAKIIDGELIVIRLSDGTYYSMDNVGAQVWTLIEAHREMPAIIETIATWYGVSPATVADDLGKLVQSLLEERLVAVGAEGVGGLPAPDRPPSPLLPYETPRLNTYRDMGNLLALDPPTPGIDDMPLKRGKVP